MTATPLQMANVIATIATGGIRYRPHFVSGSRRPRATAVPEHVRAQVTALGVRDDARWRRCAQALRDVVNDDRGTGKKARLRRHRGRRQDRHVAGGASSADRAQGEQQQLPREQRDHAWFVAYAPVEEPEIAVAVLVEHAAAAAARSRRRSRRQVLAYYFGLHEDGR